MPLVDQDEVIPLEGINGDCLFTHLVAQSRNFDDLNRSAGVQSPSLLVEDLGVDSCRLELAEMLLAQPLVGVRSKMRFNLRPRWTS